MRRTARAAVQRCEDRLSLQQREGVRECDVSDVPSKDDDKQTGEGSGDEAKRMGQRSAWVGIMRVVPLKWRSCGRCSE